MTIEQDTIKYDSKNNFIIMKTHRDASAERMIRAFDQILALSEIENCKTVLIDATKTKKLPSVGNLYSVGTFMSKQILKLSEMRVTFAISNEISKDFVFFDNVLANRGVNFRTFKNVYDAKKWLLGK